MAIQLDQLVALSEVAHHAFLLVCFSGLPRADRTSFGCLGRDPTAPKLHCASAAPAHGGNDVRCGYSSHAMFVWGQQQEQNNAQSDAASYAASLI